MRRQKEEEGNKNLLDFASANKPLYAILFV